MTDSSPQNLYSGLPKTLPDELIETLVQNEQVRLEKIVSTGHASPDGFWYDQEESEWVMVLKGAAGLQFEGEEQIVSLQPGDHLLIPAHRKHRVAWTSLDEPTLWLALFFQEPDN